MYTKTKRTIKEKLQKNLNFKSNKENKILNNLEKKIYYCNKNP